VLLMKKEFFEKIRSGAKTTTLRFWRRCHLRAGSVQTVPGLGKVRIDTAQPVEVNDLTDEDARVDGFESLQGLARALHELYPPEKREGRRLYRIRFTYMPDESDAGPQARPSRKAAMSETGEEA